MKKLIFKTILCLALALFAFPQTGAFAMAKRHQTFNVEVKVDYGPAGKPAIDKTIEVEKGSTPKDAVSQVAPILSGKSCCDFREVMEIGGVRIDPAKNRWWICELNGSRKISPQKKKLKEGDVIKWIYAEDEQ